MEEGSLYLYVTAPTLRVWYLWHSCGPLEWRQVEMEFPRHVLTQPRGKPNQRLGETEGQMVSDADRQEG